MLTVHLTTVGNPDYQQYAPITNPETCTAPTLAVLRDRIRDWQADWQVGGGNWTEPTVYRDDTAIGYLSYNLRLWDLAARDVPFETLYGPNGTIGQYLLGD